MLEISFYFSLLALYACMEYVFGFYQFLFGGKGEGTSKWRVNFPLCPVLHSTYCHNYFVSFIDCQINVLIDWLIDYCCWIFYLLQWDVCSWLQWEFKSNVLIHFCCIAGSNKCTEPTEETCIARVWCSIKTGMQTCIISQLAIVTAFFVLWSTKAVYIHPKLVSYQPFPFPFFNT